MGAIMREQSVYVMRKALQEGGPKKVHLIVCCSCSIHSDDGYLDSWDNPAGLP